MKILVWSVVGFSVLSGCDTKEFKPGAPQSADTGISGASVDPTAPTEISVNIPQTLMTIGTVMEVSYAKDPDQPTSDCSLGLAPGGNARISGLEPDTLYNVRACLKNTTSAVMRSQQFQVRTYALDPGDVSNVQIQNGGNATRNLTWSPGVEANGYRIVWAAGDTAPVSCDTVGSSVTDVIGSQANIDFKTPGRYAVRVCSSRTNAQKRFSAGITAIVVVPYAALAAVQNLRVTANNGINVSLAWDSAPNAKDYVVEYLIPTSGLAPLMSLDFGSSDPLKLYRGRVVTTQNSVTLSALNSWSTYQFTVRPRASDDTTLRSISASAQITAFLQGPVNDALISATLKDGSIAGDHVSVVIGNKNSGGVIAYAQKKHASYPAAPCPIWLPKETNADFNIQYPDPYNPTIELRTPLSLTLSLNVKGFDVLASDLDPSSTYRVTVCSYADSGSLTDSYHHPEKIVTSATAFEVLTGTRDADTQQPNAPMQITVAPTSAPIY